MKNKIKFVFMISAFLPVLVFAQQDSVSFVLPKAGITPLSSFYFLDKLGESLRGFFTFNKEAKAKLQIVFAAERIAEIKVILETKGVEAKGLSVAEDRLKSHIANAASIIESEREKGKDVSSLAKELDNEVEISKSFLPSVFKEKKGELKNKEEELKNKISEAREIDDSAKVDILRKELEAVKAERRSLYAHEREQKEALENEQEKIEREMEKKEEAAKAIRKAEEEKREIISEAKEKEIILPLEGFLNFDGLVIEAKELFAKGNFEEAKQLTLEARKDLLSMRQIIDEMESGLEDDLEDESEVRGRESETEVRGRDAEGETEIRGREAERELRGRESENEVRGREAENEPVEAGSGRNR